MRARQKICMYVRSSTAWKRAVHLVRNSVCSCFQVIRAITQRRSGGTNLYVQVQCLAKLVLLTFVYTAIVRALYECAFWNFINSVITSTLVQFQANLQRCTVRSNNWKIVDNLNWYNFVKEDHVSIHLVSFWSEDSTLTAVSSFSLKMTLHSVAGGRKRILSSRRLYKFKRIWKH